MLAIKPSTLGQRPKLPFSRLSISWSIASPAQVSLAWTPVVGAASYLVRRMSSPAFVSNAYADDLNETSQLALVDAGIVAQDKRYYVVHPVYPGGHVGAASNLVGAIAYPTKQVNASMFMLGLPFTNGLTNAKAVCTYTAGNVFQRGNCNRVRSREYYRCR